MNARGRLLLRLVFALLVAMAFAQLHACTSPEDRSPAARSRESTSTPSPPAVDVPVNLLLRARDTVVTGPNAHPFRLRFDRDGATLLRSTDARKLSLRLARVGRDGAPSLAIARKTPELEESVRRVVYASDDVVEWYEPTLQGLEQGFTIAHRPPKHGALYVDVAIADGYEAIPSKLDGAIDLKPVDEPDATFRYGKLDVEDARGAKLAARLEPRGKQGIRIVIDDASATYPVTVDPLVWSLQAKLTLLSEESRDFFGTSVGISGDTILAGAPARDNFTGVVAFFERTGGSWHEKQILETTTGDGVSFSYYAAMDGERAVIGSNHIATVVDRAAGAWSPTARLAPDWFSGLGNPVGISGDTVVVSVVDRNGTFLPDGGVDDSGAGFVPPPPPYVESASFVYERSGNQWPLVATLVHPVPTREGMSGVPAVEGDLFAVGLGLHVLVYRRSQAGVWSLETAIPQPSDVSPSYDGVYGYSVAVSGGTLLASSFPSTNAYDRIDGIWTRTGKLTAPLVFGGNFGNSVAMAGDHAFVADPGRAVTGAAFRYRRIGKDWALEEEVAPADLGIAGFFPTQIAMTKERAVFGAPTQGLHRGRVYVYELRSSLGDACTSGEACASGHCADGVCCDSACGGGDVHDCLACNGALTRGLCSPADNGVECRAATSTCDVAERCDGVSLTCPADRVQPNGTTCATGQCISGACVGSTDAAPTSDAGPLGAAPASGSASGCSVTATADAPSPVFVAVAALSFLLLLGRRRWRALPLGLLVATANESSAASLAIASEEQALRVRVDDNGATWIDERTGRAVRLELTSFGRGPSPVEGGVAARVGDRVQIAHNTLLEWYEARPDGIEQGFDVRDRPPGTGPLKLRLEGTTRDAGGRIALGNDREKDPLLYGELKVIDARGNVLGASLEREGAGLTITIDDREARYPIVIDPLVWRERSPILPPTNQTLTRFGRALAAENDLVVVGRPGTAIAPVIYRRKGTSWQKDTELVADDLFQVNHLYGAAIAIYGSTIAVGAPYARSFSGRVYVFDRIDGQWVQTAVLAPDVAQRNIFGTSVVLKGNTLVVGAPNLDRVGGSGHGEVHVFTRDAGVWTQRAKLDGEPTARQFGARVAFDGENLIVTATLCELEVSASALGEVHFFRGAGATWTRERVIREPIASSLFGCDLSLVGDTAAIGTPFPFNTRSYAEIYERKDGAWSVTAKLSSNDPIANDYFGFATKLEKDRLLIGALGGNDGKGAAYLFERAGGTWTETKRFVASDGVLEDRFGVTVAFAGDTALIGASDRKQGTGAVYTYLLGLEGDACTTGDVCASGFCIDGVCCENECGGGREGDCMACSVAKGAAKDGACGPAKGVVCRAKRPNDDCDVADTCDGASLSCPADVAAPNGTRCNGGAGVCGGGACVPLTQAATVDARPGAAPTSAEGGCAMHHSTTSTRELALGVGALVLFRRQRRSRRDGFSSG